MHRSLAVLLTLLLVGCSSAGERGAVLNLLLDAGPQNAGAIAQATLVAQGEVTALSLVIGGVPAGTSRPLHLYSYIYSGRCARLADQPAYSLNERILATRTASGWVMSKRLPVSLEQLRRSEHALVLRTSPADRSLQIFCGDIPGF